MEMMNHSTTQDDCFDHKKGRRMVHALAVECDEMASLVNIEIVG